MRRLKRIATVIALIVLIGMAYRVLGVYEFRTGECSAKPTRRTFAQSYPKRLVVMSYNIQGHASFVRNDHIEEIAKVINAYKPDVVGINEAHRNTWQARFGDHVNQLAALTSMKVVFGRSYSFLGGQFGNAVLTRGEIVKSDVHDLPGTGEPRTLLDSIVKVNGGVIEFYVAHTAAWASLGEKTRDLQMQCIQDHIAASKHPYILTGDLNAPPESPEMAKFFGMQRLRLAADPQQPTHRVMNQHIDYVLTDPGWQVRSARVLDDGPSDHRPVLAELIHP